MKLQSWQSVWTLLVLLTSSVDDINGFAPHPASVSVPEVRSQFALSLNRHDEMPFATTISPKTIQATTASALSGAGPITVDMNLYNLPLERITEEWVAVVSPATPLQQEGIYLAARNSKELFVDRVKVQLPRRRGAGLGLELWELAGGREDGLGITIVSGIVPGGCSDGSDIIEGDSIENIQVFDSTGKEMASVSTECLGYDKTVEVLRTLPTAENDFETIILSLRRLRRKPKVNVTIQYPPEMCEKDITLELFSGENLRRSMLVKGIKLNDALARRFDSGGSGDCGAEGTCATCAIAVMEGSELLNPANQVEKQIFQNSPRLRMSCRTIVGYGMTEGDLRVRVSPARWNI